MSDGASEWKGPYLGSSDVVINVTLVIIKKACAVIVINKIIFTGS